ncbi:MAG: GNAT family N-acetyltransferase, partial [Clostridia bacterium]|nr:GNAT family N-acetyltransferase [Clostridia bacterium]
MITRLLKPEESWIWSKVMAVAFEYGLDIAKAKEEAEKEKTEEELKKAAKDRCFASFAEDGKTVYGCVNSHEYTCRFDGGTYLLGGIGGVSTLPPYRRKGAIRACITESLKDMYANDFTFSYLFPFSTEYYRKFGYEVAGVAHEWTLNLKDIRPRDVGGTMEQLFPGDDMSPLLEVYNQCFSDVNMSALRDTYSEELNEKNFMNDMRYVYLWRNDAGKPRGLMISRKEHKDGKTFLNCTHTFGCRCGFLFCDAEALNALLFFAKSAFSSDYDAIRFAALPQQSITSLVGENNEAECKPFWNGMLRVVNVQRVLENCRCRGTG